MNKVFTDTERLSTISKTSAVCLWIGIILFCLIHKDKITVESIVYYTPEEPVSAALIMLCLFAVKSVTLFIYGGILYAVNGILFPMPIAVGLNIAGSVIMTSIPFLIGKKAGTNAMDTLVKQNKKLAMLKDITNQNELLISFFIRIIGILPSDLVGMYLGASGIGYRRYLCGTILGMLPSILSFSVMGMSSHDISSPEFILSVCFEISLMIVSFAIYFIWRRRTTAKI